MSRTIKVVGCFIIHGGKFLIFKRSVHKHLGNTWGLPAGEIKDNETELEAICREMQEETGYKPESNKIERVLDYTHNKDIDNEEEKINFIAFKLVLDEQIKIKYYSNEHSDFKWVTWEECYDMKDLIYTFHELLEKIKNKL
jgi:8-oxo-dGTP pyrophosphatase MutT (NUDIX family)